MASGSPQHITVFQPRDYGLRRLGTVLRERAWLIFIFALLGGAVATVYGWYAPKDFSATAVVSYRVDQLRLLDLAGPRSATGEKALDEQLAALRRMLSSASLLRRVAESSKLSSVPSYGGGLSGSPALDRAVLQLQKRLRVEVPPNDIVINVTVSDSVAARSADLANAVVDELLAENTKARQQLLGEVSTQLESVLGKMREELNTSNAPAATPSAVSDGRAELRMLGEKAATAEFNYLQAEAGWAASQSAGTNLEAILQLPAYASAPELAAKRAEYQEKKRAFEITSQRYKGLHTNYVTARDELEAAKTALVSQVAVVGGRLRAAVEEAKAARDAAQHQFDAKLQSVQSATPPSATGTASLAERDLDVARQYYERLMAKMKELKVSKEYFESPLTIAQSALPPTRADGVNPIGLTGYGLLAGFIAGLLVSLVFGLGDTSLKGVDETERVLGLPVLSVVPKLKDNDTEMAAAEGFRSLRTSISVSSKGKEPRVVLFTSTSPDEGKTFCALNYSVGLAQQGHKTVLIECDLRRPMAAPSLTMVKVDAPGVSDFLKVDGRASTGEGPQQRQDAGLSFAEIRRKRVESTEDEAGSRPLLVESTTSGLGLEDVLQQTEVTNLFFVAAGKPVANPTELLSRPRFEQLLNGLLQRYDRVVLDSAPVLGVSETLLLANRVQGVCFVVRGGHTPRNAVLRAVEVLRRANAPVLGTVLNGINPKHSDPYGQDYYYHKSPGRS